VRVTRITVVVGVLIYAGLWVIAASGARELMVILAVPAVLALMIALGVALQRYLGVTPHRPKFKDSENDQS
jgi:hypothetical protein